MRQDPRGIADLCNVYDHYLRQLPLIPRTSRLIRTESKNRVVRPQGSTEYSLSYGMFVATSSRLSDKT